MSYGQDRYRRRYWVLPQCGGVYIEAMESGEGEGHFGGICRHILLISSTCISLGEVLTHHLSSVGLEELEKERERLKNFQAVQVKEEPQEELTEHQEEEEEEEISAVPVKEEELKQEDKLVDPHQETDKEMRFSPLKELQGTEPVTTPPPPPKPRPSTSPACQELPHTPAGLRVVATDTTSASSPARSPTTSKLTEGGSPGPEPPVPPPLQLSVPAHVLQPHTQLLPTDQLLRVLGERSGHWFSLLPRSPCDDTSVSQPKTPPPTSTSSPHHHHHHQLLSLSGPLNPSSAGIQVTLRLICYRLFDLFNLE